MFYYIQTWWRWLRRCGLSRGFGVQSPSAYAFIRYVVNEHYPYYAYSELKSQLRTLTRRQHKLGRLLFRLANFWQPEARYCDEEIYLPYMYAGCHRSSVCSLSQLDDSSEKKMIVLDLNHVHPDALFSDILPLCHEQTLLILLGLNKNKAIWKKLQQSSSTGITYHLYYVGIVFFDLSKYKQHYDVNF